MPHPPKNFHNKVLGRQGENATVGYLKKRGYRIVARNFETPFGETDIIAEKGGVYAFVEVKLREHDAFGLPAEAVTREKQRKYRLMAGFFCCRLKREVPVRFDVSAIFEGGLEYFENAFI